MRASAAQRKEELLAANEHLYLTERRKVVTRPAVYESECVGRVFVRVGTALSHCVPSLAEKLTSVAHCLLMNHAYIESCDPAAAVHLGQRRDDRAVLEQHRGRRLRRRRDRAVQDLSSKPTLTTTMLSLCYHCVVTMLQLRPHYAATHARQLNLLHRTIMRHFR